MSAKIAFLFPGQGSQYVGMGEDLARQFPEAKRIFDQVDEICQRPISTLCHKGPLSELTSTQNLQPAVTAVNLACLAALKGAGISPTVSAGHSLGEYSALVSASVITSYDALRLVAKRGELMHREALANPGGMAAILGMNNRDLQEIIAQAKDKGILCVANQNAADQIVISGEKAPLSLAMRLVEKRRGMAVPLNISGAWHSKLMQGAVEEFREFMEDVPFSRPESQILFNATAQGETDPDHIKDLVANQLVSPANWYQTGLVMLQDSIHSFVEVGPKRVLIGLLKRIINPEKQIARFFSVQDIMSLSIFLKENPLTNH